MGRFKIGLFFLACFCVCFQVQVYSLTVCPDGDYFCPTNATCCAEQQFPTGKSWRCCLQKDAVCCQDGGCCPRGMKCAGDNELGICVPANESERKILRFDNNCPDNTTQCDSSNGLIMCCPYVNGTCCLDGQHCCPTDYACDLEHKRCVLSSVPQDHQLRTAAVIEPYLTKPNNSMNEQAHYCPGSSDAQCPDSSTCCQQGNSWGCCPLPNAVCCSDQQTCCPDGWSCDGNGNCRKNSNLFTQQKKKTSESNQLRTATVVKPYLKKSNNSMTEQAHYCPGSSDAQCPDSSTCCQQGNSWGCCPLPNAVCCSDQQTCCPDGWTCDGDGNCRKNSKLISRRKAKTSESNSPAYPILVRTTSLMAHNVNHSVSVHAHNCPGSADAKCMDGTTCCPQGNSWGCCPMPNAVCCADQQTCCPNGWSCDGNGNCQKNSDSSTKTMDDASNTNSPGYPILVLTTSLMAHNVNHSVSVHAHNCPGSADAKCMDGTTCCPQGNSWGCCPMPKAVCCADQQTCCPNGWSCDGNGGCQKNSDASLKFKAETEKSEMMIDRIMCDSTGKYSCANQSKCCATGNSEEPWKCCIHANGVCCKSGGHCCPKGYKCYKRSCRRLPSARDFIPFGSRSPYGDRLGFDRRFLLNLGAVPHE